MKSNARSSITLPPDELRLVNELMKRTRTRTKVAVVRKALRLLDATTNREQLRKAYRDASLRVREATREELSELDHLATEGLGE